MKKIFALLASFTFILLLTGCLFPEVDDLLEEKKEIIDIDLTGKGMEFKDGNFHLGKASSSPEGTSFPITIKNKGGETLVFNSNPPVIISGPDRDSFSIDFSSFSTSLGPGEETGFELIFKSSKSGKNYCSLTIPNNSYMSPHTMNLSIDGLFSNKIFTSGAGGSNDQLNAVTYDSYGNIIAAGYGTNLVSSNSKKDWWIKKFNSDGDLIWERYHDGNGKDDEITCVAVTKEGHLIAAGYGTNLISSTTQEDWWIRKYDWNGYLMWERKFDHYYMPDHINSISLDSWDNVVIGGTANSLSFSSSQTDWLIIKLDSGGNLRWRRIYDAFGGIDELHTVSAAEGGYVYAAGVAKDPGYGCDIIILKINGNFSFVLENRIYAGLNDNIKLTSDSKGNIYAVGHGANLLTGFSGPDIWISKYNARGEVVFDEILDDDDCDTIEVTSIIADNNENIYLGGYGQNLVEPGSGMDWWVKKLDSSASPLWTNRSDISQVENISAIYPVEDNALLIGGYGKHAAQNNSHNDWILKKITSSDGNFE